MAPSRGVHAEAGGFCWFDLDGVEVGFHLADEERNPVGGSSVVYWSASDLDTQRRKLLEAGCQPHRGPLDIQPGRRIRQLVDTYGNIFGIDGLRQQECPPAVRIAQLVRTAKAIRLRKAAHVSKTTWKAFPGTDP